MEKFTYQAPIENSVIIPRRPKINDYEMLDEQGETVFLIRIRKHRSFARIIHEIPRDVLPYCYQVLSAKGEPLYTIDCAFPGIRYKLTEHLSSQIVPIIKRRVGVIDKIYSFRLDNHDYVFEKDWKSAGHLECDNTHVATVWMPPKTDVSFKDAFLKGKFEDDKFVIDSTTKENASLAAVLFHTFYYYGA